MRTLLAIVVLAALGWSAYWWVHATAMDRAMTGWLADRRAAGWVAEAEDVRVRGFPSRVDTIVTGLDLADPRGGWAWQAEEFQVLSLSYRPNHVIAVLPGEQVLSTPYETIRAKAGQLRGSVIFRPTPRLELDAQAEVIARAVGPRGPNADYLMKTVAGLEALGLHDPELVRLAAMVRDRLAA